MLACQTEQGGGVGKVTCLTDLRLVAQIINILSVY